MNKEACKCENKTTTGEEKIEEPLETTSVTTDTEMNQTSEGQIPLDSNSSSYDPSPVDFPTEITDATNETATPSEIDRIRQLETEVQRLSEESRSYLDALQRLKAEFDNYRKRILRERQLTEQLIKEELILKLLPIIDNLDLAVKAGQDRALDKALLEGIALIIQQIIAFFKELDINRISTIDTQFDPNFHEAVITIEKEGAASGIILQEISPGYTMNKRVIRPAKVVVCR